VTVHDEATQCYRTEPTFLRVRVVPDPNPPPAAPSTATTAVKRAESTGKRRAVSPSDSVDTNPALSEPSTAAAAKRAAGKRRAVPPSDPAVKDPTDTKRPRVSTTTASADAADAAGAAGAAGGGGGEVSLALVRDDGVADLSRVSHATLVTEVDAIIKDLWKIYAGKLPSWRHDASVAHTSSPTLRANH
jgi:hypothetical protein